jgi:hypothetical protein
MTALPDWMRPPRAEGWFAEDLDRLPEAPRHPELIDGARRSLTSLTCLLDDRPNASQVDIQTLKRNAPGAGPTCREASRTSLTSGSLASDGVRRTVSSVLRTLCGQRPGALRSADQDAAEADDPGWALSRSPQRRAFGRGHGFQSDH